MTTDGVDTSWRWATVLAVHPVLTTGVLAGLLLFALTSTASTAFGLPKFIPLFPGGLMLLFLGLGHLYTPVYVAGLALDRRRVRATDTAWVPSRLGLLGACSQIVYFAVPIVQAYGGETFEELVFGSVELAALLCTGVVTVKYLAVRDSNLPRAPALVSLWSGVWFRVAQGRRFFT
ncbi:hypothetical protein [Haloarcula argentinensis]|uniref:Uncharacterized protein n=1 Tax=Haloarcula argentinensis TaxID=43776 RepID=A0A847U802_HALAR|nr:hypothetical protein [Haloarcula argentinensis]NLV11873.1 hypothetical protein [Haloarcula argentinensis]